MEYFNKVLDRVAQKHGWGNFEDVYYNGEYSHLTNTIRETVEIINGTKKVWNVLDSEYRLVCICYNENLSELKHFVENSELKDVQYVYANTVLTDAEVTKEIPVCGCCGSLNLDCENIADLHLCLDCEFLMYEPTKLKNYNYNTKQLKI